MNWLTRQLVGPLGQEILRSSTFELQPWDDPSLRRVPFRHFREGFKFPSHDLGEDWFLLCEQTEDARERESVAVETESLTGTFTTCIDWGEGHVFYLPDDLSRRPTVQAFADYGGWLTVGVAQVSLEHGSVASIGETTTVVRTEDDCELGPCRRGADGRYGCGPGCVCKKQEHDPGSGPPRTYYYKCCR
jgi:hypothetical protein